MLLPWSAAGFSGRAGWQGGQPPFACGRNAMAKPPSCSHCLLQAEAIGEACSQLAVKPPASYSGPRPGAQLYHAVVATAQQPELAIPETPSLKASCMHCCCTTQCCPGGVWWLPPICVAASNLCGFVSGSESKPVACLQQ